MKAPFTSNRKHYRRLVLLQNFSSSLGFVAFSSAKFRTLPATRPAHLAAACRRLRGVFASQCPMTSQDIASGVWYRVEPGERREIT
jgi:hypothetical protein